MNKFTESVTWAGLLIWKHCSAFIAVVLIIAALIIGYRWGKPGPEPADEAAETRQDPTTAPDTEPQMYTCAMHPAVQLPDPDGVCPICFMALTPVNDLVLEGFETTRVGRFFPTAEVRLYGKLTYDETSVARITAYFPGRLDRLFVNYVGVPVAKGDHLAEMYSPELLAALAELRQARIAVDEIQTPSPIIRTSTERTLESARERLRLFGVTDDQVAEAEAGEASDERLTVYSPIAGIVTHLAAREGDYVETGSPIATVADLSRLWLDMEAYESQLPMLRWGQPVTFTVEAQPGKEFNGQISFIEPIVDDRTRTAAVRVALDNTDGQLKPGMFASAVVRPRVAAGGAVLSDELAGRWVGPMHPTVVRDEPGECDICGMDLVTAESLGVVGDPSVIEEPLVIPRSAALLTGTRAVVYVKTEGPDGPTYNAREVTLGPRAGEFYIVEKGLQVGEQIAVKGVFRIDSAMQIAAKPSMMMPGGGGVAHQHGGQSAGQTTRAVVPERFVFSLKPVYAAYLDAQEALAADDLSGFLVAAGDLKTAVDLVEEIGLVGEPLGTWRRAATRLRLDAAITTTEDARVRFERMSVATIELLRTFGHRGSNTWHLAFCPMAFDDAGAEWIQRGGAEINNPYFGASMLRCGEIRGEFAPIEAVIIAPTTAPTGEDEHEGQDHD